MDRRLTAAQEQTADAVEEASLESFPASDAPAWTCVTGVGTPTDAVRSGKSGLESYVASDEEPMQSGCMPRL